jgi:hypothetical protein
LCFYNYKISRCFIMISLMPVKYGMADMQGD